MFCFFVVVFFFFFFFGFFFFFFFLFCFFLFLLGLVLLEPHCPHAAVDAVNIKQVPRMKLGCLGFKAELVVRLTADPGVASSNTSSDKTSMEIDHEIISTTIFPLQLI